jgi:ABC-type hemin transport system substrate-binding protein
MTRTSSGAIVLAHRFPGYSVNISRDGGRNWDAGTIIDWQPWGQGALIEVEPDVLLVTYMNTDLGDWHNLVKTDISPLLSQRFRITQDRIVPLGPDD